MPGTYGLFDSAMWLSQHACSFVMAEQHTRSPDFVPSLGSAVFWTEVVFSDLEKYNLLLLHEIKTNAAHVNVKNAFLP